MISVVMSVFNGERFLREAVESILDQSFREFEFIVIDDGSTDRSASILDCYQNKDTRVMVHHKEHSGLIESLNRGCWLAQGKYIARMDADDVAIKDRLMWQVHFMETHPQIGALGGAVEWIDGTGKSLGTHRYPAEDHHIKATLLQGCAFWHPTVILRREVFAWAGGYRSVVVDAEDYDLWLRIADHFQLANLEAVVLKYRIHPFQASMRNVARQALGILGAQVAASSRRAGIPDPLNSLKEITPEALATLGVTKARQQDQVASYSVHWIRNMFTAGEYSAALKGTLEVLHSDLEYVERWTVADLRLLAARLYWKQGRIVRSCLSVAHAFRTWPIMVGRPIKPLLRRLHLLNPRKLTPSWKRQ
jgi:glycosyltransferase involved in cell wall biosynthesis